MPQVIDALVSYGALGAIVAFVLIAIWKVGHALYEQLFSRDPQSKGLVVMKVEASIAKDRKLAEFVDALADRDVHQQELCDRHNAGLTQIATNLSAHDGVGRDTYATVRRLELVAREAVLATKVAALTDPIDTQRVLEHLSRIERIVDQTAREVG